MYKAYSILEYNTWKDFRSNITNDLCKKTLMPEKKYIFRGQRSHEWTLTTGFDRMFGNLEFEKRKAIETSLILEFRNGCIDFLNSNKFAEYDDVQILSLGQHYGLPTRLLDWSYSMYVAAFFAFAYNMSADSDSVAIWVIDRDHQIWSEDYGVKIVTSRLDENKYQKHQKGIFTLNKSPHLALEEFVQACSSRCNTENALTKILIPYQERNIVLNDLDMMGINHTQLFPGFEGCAKTALLKEIIKYDLK